MTLVPPGVRAAVRPSQQDRSRGCGSDPRSRALGRDAERAGETHRAAGAGRVAPRARAVDDDADGADQHAARDCCGSTALCCRPVRARRCRRSRASWKMPTTPLPAHLRHVLAERARGGPRARERASPRSSASCARSPTPIPVVTRLRTIPGIGLLTATALVGARGAHPRVSTGATVCELAGADAARTLQRRAPPARRHQ